MSGLPLTITLTKEQESILEYALYCQDVDDIEICFSTGILSLHLEVDNTISGVGEFNP